MICEKHKVQFKDHCEECKRNYLIDSATEFEKIRNEILFKQRWFWNDPEVVNNPVTYQHSTGSYTFTFSGGNQNNGAF